MFMEVQVANINPVTKEVQEKEPHLIPVSSVAFISPRVGDTCNLSLLNGTRFVVAESYDSFRATLKRMN